MRRRQGAPLRPLPFERTLEKDLLGANLQARRTSVHCATGHRCCSVDPEAHDESTTYVFECSSDGQPPGTSHGADVDGDGSGTVVEQRLYQLIRQSRPIAERPFEIEFLDAGVEIFAFTFG